MRIGCLVRLRLSDFMMSQYGPEVDKEAEYLASLPPAGRLVYESRKLATSSISPGLFDILDANDLLPTDPGDPSYQYLCKGNINRRIGLRRGEPGSVFIILSGSLQVTLMRHMRSILALKEEDDSETIAVKVSIDCIMIVSLICLMTAVVHRSTGPHWFASRPGLCFALTTRASRRLLCTEHRRRADQWRTRNLQRQAKTASRHSTSVGPSRPVRCFQIWTLIHPACPVATDP